MHATPPPVSQVQPVAPAVVSRIVERCLAKDPDDRWQTARDLVHELKWVAEGGVSRDGVAPTTLPAARSWSRALTWMSVAAALVFAIAWLAVWAPWRVVPRPHVTRTTITPAGLAARRSATATRIFPRRIQTFIGKTQLFVRALDALESVKIASGAVHQAPFFSPDGQWVGFTDNQSVKGQAHRRRVHDAPSSATVPGSAPPGRPTTRSSSRPPTRRPGCSACRPPEG
jgi:serine/threonine-protein kinase